MVRVTNPPILNLSQIIIDADLAMGAHNITLGAAQTVDGRDVSAINTLVSGTYVGNGNVNRAVAHGLGVIPKHVIIVGVDGFVAQLSEDYNGARLLYTNAAADGFYAVTALDADNFYVGNAGSFPNSVNNAGAGYGWMAWV